MDDRSSSSDRARFGKALLGFYLSCTGFGIGVTVAAAALIVFGDAPASGPVAAVAIVLTAVCGVLSWWTLKLARRT